MATKKYPATDEGRRRYIDDSLKLYRRKERIYFCLIIGTIIGLALSIVYLLTV